MLILKKNKNKKTWIKLQYNDTPCIVVLFHQANAMFTQCPFFCIGIKFYHQTLAHAYKCVTQADYWYKLF